MMFLNNISPNLLFNKEYLDNELINRNNDDEIVNIKMNIELIKFMEKICLVYGEDYYI